MSGELMTWAVLGNGTIGSELQRQLASGDVASRHGLQNSPNFVLQSSGIYVDDKLERDADEIYDMPLVDMLFVALPSTSDGQPASYIMQHMLDEGVLVVTAEKGALSNEYENFRGLSDDFSRLGINATVGGGTRLLEGLGMYSHDPKNIREIHLALNGTLAYILGAVGRNNGHSEPLGIVVDQAIKLGLAEPGALNPHEVIRGEALGDVPKKTAIVFNHVLHGAHGGVSLSDLEFSLTSEDVSRVIQEAKVRRMIVSIFNQAVIGEVVTPDDVVGGFSLEVDNWKIVAGFQEIGKNPVLDPFASLNGAQNGFVVGLGPVHTDGIYSLFGPGAGPKPTVNTMIDDAGRLISASKRK